MIFKTGIKEEEHIAFLKEKKVFPLNQSPLWRHIKDNWGCEFLGVYKDESEKELIASCMALIRPLPMGFTMVYLSRGPVMDHTDKELVKFFCRNLRKWAKKKKCVFAKADPYVLYRKFRMGEEGTYNPEYDEIVAAYTEAGFKYGGLTEKMHETIQPRFHMTVFKEEFSEENMTSKGKKNLKKAYKSNLDTRKTGIEGLEDFSKVMQSTEKRQSVRLRDSDYYEKLLTIYGDDAFLMLTYIDIEKTYLTAKARYEECVKGLEECPENAHKKRFKLEETLASVSRDYKDFGEYLKKYGKETCVCGTLTVRFGGNAEVLYAGMNDEFKRYMAPYATWMKTFEECFDNGVNTVNMGGVDGSLSDGLTQFKSSFSPEICEYMGEFDLPVMKLLYTPVKKLYLKMKR